MCCSGQWCMCVCCSGQVPARAEYNYLDRVRWLDMYGVVLHPVKVSAQIGHLFALDNELGVCNRYE